ALDRRRRRGRDRWRERRCPKGTGGRGAGIGRPDRWGCRLSWVRLALRGRPFFRTAGRIAYVVGAPGLGFSVRALQGGAARGPEGVEVVEQNACGKQTKGDRGVTFFIELGDDADSPHERSAESADFGSYVERSGESAVFEEFGRHRGQ